MNASEWTYQRGLPELRDPKEKLYEAEIEMMAEEQKRWKNLALFGYV